MSSKLYLLETKKAVMTTKRAIISVYDKTGAEKFARELAALGYEI